MKGAHALSHTINSGGRGGRGGGGEQEVLKCFRATTYNSVQTKCPVELL